MKLHTPIFPTKHVPGTSEIAQRELLAETVISGAPAAVDFIDLLTYPYAHFEFEFDEVVPTDDAVDFFCRTSTDNGATFDAGASNYINVGWAQNSGGLNESQDAALTRIVLSNRNEVGDEVSNVKLEKGIQGFSRLHLKPGDTALFWHKVIHVSAGASGEINMVINYARRLDTGTVNAVRYLWEAGEFASGTIRLWGLP